MLPSCERDESGLPMRVFDDTHSLSLLPPDKLRFTLGPLEDVGEVRIELETFQRALAKILEPKGLRALSTGCKPDTGNVDALGFASTIVSLERVDGADPTREHELVRAIAPLLALLGDNAPRSSQTGHIAHACALHAIGHDVTLDGTSLVLMVADSLPAPFATGFVTAIKGLLASDESMDAARAIAHCTSEADIEEVWSAIARDGFDAIVYGKPAAELAGQLLACAREALATNEHNYLVPLEQMARKRQTLTMLSAARNRGN